jgi:hypothetical protein
MAHPKPPEHLRKPLAILTLVLMVVIIVYAISTIGDFDQAQAAVLLPA